MSDKTPKDPAGKIPEELVGMGDLMPQLTVEGWNRIARELKARENDGTGVPVKKGDDRE